MALHNSNTNKKFQPNKQWNAKKTTFSNNKSWSKKPYYNNNKAKNNKNNKNNKREYKFKPYDPKDYDRVRKQIIDEFFKEYPKFTLFERTNKDPLEIVEFNPYSYKRFKKLISLFKKKLNRPSYLIDFIRYLRLFSIYLRKPSHKRKAHISAFIKIKSKYLEKNKLISRNRFLNLPFFAFHRYQKLNLLYPIPPYAVGTSSRRRRIWRLRMHLREDEFKPTVPDDILSSPFIKETAATFTNPTSIFNRLRYFKFMTAKSWYLPGWYRKLVRNPLSFEGNPIFNLRSEKHRFKTKELRELYYELLESVLSIYSKYNIFKFEGPVFNERFFYQLAAYLERATLLRLIKLRLYRPKEYIHKPHMPHMYFWEENDLRFSDLVLDNRQIITPYFNASHDNYCEDLDNDSLYQDVDDSIKSEEILFEEKFYPTRFRPFPTSSYNIKTVSVKNNIFMTVSYQGRSALNRIRNWRLFEKLKGDHEVAAQIKPHKLIENASLLGRTIAVRCGGMMTGYKGRRRSTPSACEEMGRRVGKFLQYRKIRSAMITIHAHDDNMVNAALKGISEKRFKLEFPELVFKPLIPHGHGLRAKKRRRV